LLEGFHGQTVRCCKVVSIMQWFLSVFLQKAWILILHRKKRRGIELFLHKSTVVRP
jgi:hypothetical protein